MLTLPKFSFFRTWRLIAAVIAACLLAPDAIAGPAEDGVIAYRKGDYAKALDLWRTAAEAGHAAAQNNLGILYDLGKGVPRSDKLAHFWFLKSARQGFANAMFNLGRKYDNGEGVEANEVVAYMWFVLAAEGGDPAFAVHRDKLAKQLTADEIRTGRQLAQKWIVANHQ